MIVLTSLEEVAEDFLYLCVEMDRRGRRFEEGDDCWCARKNDDDRRIHLFFLVLTKVETRVNFYDDKVQNADDRHNAHKLNSFNIQIFQMIGSNIPRCWRHVDSACDRQAINNPAKQSTPSTTVRTTPTTDNRNTQHRVKCSDTDLSTHIGNCR